MSEAYANEFRTRCTTQVRTSASGYTASIASGNPPDRPPPRSGCLPAPAASGRSAPPIQNFVSKIVHRRSGKTYISHLAPHLIDIVRRAFAGETLVPAGRALACERSLPHGVAAAALGLLRALGLDRALAARRSRERDLAVALIVASLLEPRTKLATSRALRPETAASSLGQLLGLGAVDENDLYAALDWLGRRQAAVETRLAERHLREGSLVLYDLSSSWFEGRCCPLAARGYSRDRKPGTLQVVFGLLCSAEGCPVAVEVFEGNTVDSRTVAAQVEKLRERFGLSRVVLVGDRGMLTDARIREDLSGVPGLEWITAALHRPPPAGADRDGAALAVRGAGPRH